MTSSSSRFPETHLSVVEAIRSGEPDVRRRAFDTLVRAYWKPVYKYLRLRWRVAPENAEDLTQEFFARAFEKEQLERYDAGVARFRTFLRLCVDRLAQNEYKAASRLKRGGEENMISLDFAGIEQELVHGDTNAGADGTHTFDAEWVRGIFELAIERVRAECITLGRASAFAMFERYDIRGPDVQDRVTYGELAAEFEVSQSQVTNYLALVRRRLRHHLLAILRETTVTEAEFRAEIREILDR